MHKWIGWGVLGVWALAACGSASVTGDVGGPCVVGPEGGSCEDGGCRIDIPSGALELPTSIEILEYQAPSAIALDVVGARMCKVGPEDLALTRNATIRISFEEVQDFEPSALAAFTHDFPDSPPTLLEAWETEGDAEVSVAANAAISVGVTAFPSEVRNGIQLGVDAYDVSDPLSYIRNLSSELFSGAYHDGTRFYLTNGGRVLIWNDGVPTNPTALPDVILGRPSLGSQNEDASASNIGRARQVWSDGERLVVTATNRVLIWNRVPTASFTPADIVLGQDSSSSTEAREPSPTTLNDPDAIASDGTRLLISDAINNRVLIWDSFPVLNNQPADRVIGQADMFSGQVNGGAIRFQQPRGIYLDAVRTVVTSIFTNSFADVISGFPTENNAAADSTIGEGGVRRILPTAFPLPGAMSAFGESGFALRDHLGVRAGVWNSFPTSPDDAPDFFLGKPDGFVGGRTLGGVSAATLTATSSSAGLFANESIVVVPDGRRALIWNSLPNSNFAPADLVIGQPTTTTAIESVDYRGIGADTLAHPTAVSVAGGIVAIADRSNNRVLLLDEATMNPANAVIIGQSGPTDYMPNSDWHSPSESTLSAPEGVFLDGTRLVVSDSGNNRVLIWNSIPTVNAAPADVVVGQVDFASVQPNAGAGDENGDGDSDASGRSLHKPTAAVVDAGRLLVADTVNHRVLVYVDVPTTHGASASQVLGQLDLSSNAPNSETTWFTPSAVGLAFPHGLTFLPSGELLVADKENNRIVGYQAPLTTGRPADLVLGQPDAQTNLLPNFRTSASQPGLELADSTLTATAMSLRRPVSMAVTNSSLWVADSYNHRVVEYSLPLGDAPVAPTRQLGQSDFETRLENAGGLGAHSLKGPGAVATSEGRLFIADTNNHRLLTYDLESGAGMEPNEVYGQADMLGSGINASASAQGTLAGPTATSWDGRALWVADSVNHRVSAYAATDSASDTATVVLGQVDLGRNLRNAGSSEASASTLADPSDVSAEEGVLIVADRGNHRVLIWNELPTSLAQPADVVVGQRDFSAGDANEGNGVLEPTATSLFAPEGVYFDGIRLYISDTGNSRVLVFDSLPTENGTAADHVLCQQDMVSNLGNRGGPAPSANSCAWPRALQVIGDTLYVTDSLNNRILGFTGEISTALPAELVIGQPNFTSRSPVGSDGLPSASIMSNPSGLDSDGENLVVADSGNNRVLVFESLPSANGAAANAVLGQSTFTTNITGPDYSSLKQPLGVTLVKRPFHSSRIVVADSRKDRLFFYEELLRTTW